MLRKIMCALLVLPALAATALPTPTPLVTGLSETARAGPTVEGPVTGGIHGRPWFSSLIDLDDFDYVEEEFFLSGVADGAAGASDYTTRLVVRRPAEDAEYSGTVFVEWVNVTGGQDLETLWPAGWSTILEERHAYVVVSAQLVGHTELRAWDPVRYAPLTHPGDTPGSWQIFEQALQAVRNPTGMAPLGPLDAEYVIATGDSQSAGRLTSYIKNGYAMDGLIDGFIPGRGGGDAASGDVVDELQIPTIWMLEEDQAARPDDSEFQKFWFQAGAAHAPMDWAHYVWRSDMRDLGDNANVPNAINTGCSVNRGEGHMVRAGVHWINRWVRGIDDPEVDPSDYLPPTAPRMSYDDAGDMLRDADGHALGGIRYPYIEAPTGVNSATICPLFGSWDPWFSAEIIARYATHAQYMAAVTAAADASLGEGFLLGADHVNVLDAAERFDVWSEGAGICHDLAIPVERAHFDSTNRPCPPG